MQDDLERSHPVEGFPVNGAQSPDEEGREGEKSTGKRLPVQRGLVVIHQRFIGLHQDRRKSPFYQKRRGGQ